MIALRRCDVAGLNHRARGLLVDDGCVNADGVTVRDRTFGVGDRVVCLDGDRRLGVHNALFGTIVGTDATVGAVTIRPDGESRALVLPRWYLADGHLDHAYATTIHKAQGATYDRALLLGDERLYRQAGYTGLSRGRDRNDLYVVAAEHDNDDSELERHGRRPEPDSDPLDRLVGSLHRDGAKVLATSERDTGRPWGSAQPLAEQWEERDQLAQWYTHAAPPDRTDALAVARDSLTVAQNEASQAGRLRAALEGHIEQLPRLRGRHPRAHLEHELRAAGEAEQRAHQQLQESQQALVRLTVEEQARTDWHEGHRGQVDRLVHLNEMIRNRTELAGRAAEIERPAQIVAVLGELPLDPEARTTWRQAAGAIESYRVRWQVESRELFDDRQRPSDQQTHLNHVLDLIDASNAQSPLDHIAIAELG